MEKEPLITYLLGAYILTYSAVYVFFKAYEYLLGKVFQ